MPRSGGANGLERGFKMLGGCDGACAGGVDVVTVDDARVATGSGGADDTRAGNGCPHSVHEVAVDELGTPQCGHSMGFSSASRH
jgi:hypothetical protein